MLLPGRLGDDLTTAQGYQAARLTGISVPGGIRQALGSLDRVNSILRALNIVVCTPDCKLVHLVSSGRSDLLAKVFGRDRCLGGRATIGVMALASGNSFETLATVEIAD